MIWITVRLRIWPKYSRKLNIGALAAATSKRPVEIARGGHQSNMPIVGPEAAIASSTALNSLTLFGNRRIDRDQIPRNSRLDYNQKVRGASHRQ
jgi:hypothetical protein